MKAAYAICLTRLDGHPHLTPLFTIAPLPTETFLLVRAKWLFTSPPLADSLKPHTR
jgi:hypothetical protein